MGKLFGAALAAVLCAAAAAPVASAQLPLLPGGGIQPAAPAVVDAGSAPDTVTSFDGGPLHNRSSSSTLQPPLHVAWSVKTGGQVLAVPGSVVTASSLGLTALDPATGAVRWKAVGAKSAAIVGEVVVAAVGRDLMGFSLADGSVRWTRPGDGDELYSYPVPAGDLVLMQTLVDGRRYLRAIDPATGGERWVVNLTSGGTPTVVGDRVYAPLCEGGYLVLDRATGRAIDQRVNGCSGGSDTARAVGRNVRISSAGTYRTDALTTVVPNVLWEAARPGLGVLEGANRVVQAVDPISGAAAWAGRTDVGDNGRLALWVAGDTVLAANAGGVQLLDAATGASRWLGRFSNASTAGDGKPELVVAGGMAFVQHGGNLLGLRSGAPANPPKISSKIKRYVTIEFGKKYSLTGQVKESPIVVKRNVLLVSRPFGREEVRRIVGQTDASRDNTYTVKVKPSRFTTYDVSVEGADGRKRTGVIVLPAEKFRIRRGGADRNSLTVRVSLRVPRNVKLAGRTYAFYVGNRGTKRYRKVAAARIRGAGKGRGRVTLRFRALTLGKKGFTRSCITRVSRAGLNYDDRLDRRCGARSVKF